MRKKSWVMWLVLAVLAFAVMAGGGGCSGDGSEDGGGTLQGNFIDGPVEGLTYTCTPSGLSGTTDSNGAFSYKAGDTIIFYVGKIALPPVAGAGIISPLSFFDGKTTTDDEVLNIVRFIMSAGDVDADGNIKIDADPFDGREGTFDDLWDELLGDGLITVEADEAKAHVEETLLKAYSGHYNGTWKGTAYSSTQESGTWALTISEDGGVVGSYIGILGGETVLGDVTGSVDASGGTNLDAEGQAGGFVAWEGKINLANGTLAGTYVGEYEHGTFTGKKN